MKSFKRDDLVLLGKGNERLCYLHPDDPTKIIKVAYKEENARNQNMIEELYHAHMQEKGVSDEHLTHCYGTVDVEGKKGLVFDRVVNSDGSSSLTFADAVKKRVLSPDDALKLLEDLQGYLVVNNILFVDVSLDNIMCQEQEDGTFWLRIVDGLGARRPGFKFLLYRHFPRYTAYKVKSQWKKVMHNFERLLKETISDR